MRNTGRDVESINEEAEQAAARGIHRSWCTLADCPADGSSEIERRHARAALAAALPLLRLSDVPGLERQLRDKIAGELREYRADLIRTGEMAADPRERDPRDRGYFSGFDQAAGIVARGESS